MLTVTFSLCTSCSTDEVKDIPPIFQQPAMKPKDQNVEDLPSVFQQSLMKPEDQKVNSDTRYVNDTVLSITL
jgi:hypothetical protein